MSKIEWTDKTWNPIVGCKPVSEGCRHCYAERMARRLAAMKQTKHKYNNVVDRHGWTGRVHLDRDCLGKPPKSGMCFVCSMGDLFYGNVCDDHIYDVYLAMEKNPDVTFQVLTKRPHRGLRFHRMAVPPHLDNLWVGTTVEHPDYQDRIKPLLQIPAAVRFVSAEPLLGPVDLMPWLWFFGCECGLQFNAPGLDGKRLLYPECRRSVTPRDHSLDWVIVGCESGPGRRPCKLEWVRAIVDRCGAAGVPVFVKQIEIAGRVVHDVEPIAKALGYTVAEIRQFPTVER